VQGLRHTELWAAHQQHQQQQQQAHGMWISAHGIGARHQGMARSLNYI
jgi:hypothetical protein